MQDLSHMTPLQSLVGYSSMAASNTVSDESGAMTAPGSPSEMTAAAPVRASMITSSDTVGQLTTVSGQDGPSLDFGYHKPDGHGWMSCGETDVDTGTAQPRDELGRWTEK